MENKLIRSKRNLIGTLKVYHKASNRVQMFKKVMAENFPELIQQTPNPGSVSENECTSGHNLVKFRGIEKNNL